MVNLDDDKMQKIVDDIYFNRCILFLGPLIKCVNEKDELFSYLDLYSNHVIEILDKEKIDYPKEVKGNYYYYAQKLIKHRGEDVTKKLFDEIDSKLAQSLSNRAIENKRSFIYWHLAKLPFNTIVNFGSDTLMNAALKEENYDYNFAYYNYNGTEEDNVKDLHLPDKAQLVYNLLGCDKDYKSKLLTETHRLEFMHALARRPLPANLLSRFEESGGYARSFIFLGFDFEEWPFRFLLRLLGIPKNNQSISANSSSSSIAVFTEEFYDDKFGMKFLNDTNEQFVSKMIAAYSAKYGLATSQKQAYISFHPDDINYVNGFKKYTKSEKLEKVVKFSSRDEFFNEVKSDAFIEKVLSDFNIYIPFLSADFLNDDYFLSELKSVIANSKINIFPIIVRYVTVSDYIENLRSRVRFMFPEEDNYECLEAIEVNKLAKVYNNIVNTIKSTIR